jgi:hypothetical protein
METCRLSTKRYYPVCTVPQVKILKNSTFFQQNIYSFLSVSGKTRKFSLYSPQRSAFITEEASVYCAVRPGSLNALKLNLVFTTKSFMKLTNAEGNYTDICYTEYFTILRQEKVDITGRNSFTSFSKVLVSLGQFSRN